MTTSGKMRRRSFVGQTALLAAGVAGISFVPKAKSKMPARNMFVHHVYFWLKQPGNAQDKQKLIDGLVKLSSIDLIRMFHIGQPAGTSRDVIDSSYAISWLLVFDSAEQEKKYQMHPVHLQFIQECSALWSRVVVYDSIDV